MVQHKAMQMTKGQQLMLNSAVGTNGIPGLRVFVCLPQMVSHSSHLIFSFNHSFFHVKGSVRGASGLVFAGGFCPWIEVGFFRFFAER